MIHRRSTRNLLCRLFVGVLLYAQLAVAAHACPGPAAMALAMRDGMAMNHAPAASHEAMPGCDSMPALGDTGSANLCAEHCHQGQQSDQVQSAAVPPVVFTSLYPLPLPPQLAPPRRPAAFSADALAAAPPPHAILHCCFRI